MKRPFSLSSSKATPVSSSLSNKIHFIRTVELVRAQELTRHLKQYAGMEDSDKQLEKLIKKWRVAFILILQDLLEEHHKLEKCKEAFYPTNYENRDHNEDDHGKLSGPDLDHGSNQTSPTTQTVSKLTGVLDPLKELNFDSDEMRFIDSE